MTRLSIAAPAALLLLATTVTAQGRHVFDIDQGQSGFTFSGNVSLSGVGGPILGNPSNSFNVSGAADADLTVSGGVLTDGQLVRGDSTATLPTLSARVPNPIPIFPDLATVTITGVTAAFRSVDPTTLAPASFAIDGSGAFSTNVVADILSGTADVDLLVGGSQTIPMAGIVSAVAPVSGTIVSTSTGFALNIPINASFPLDDPTSGATGILNLNGTVVATDRDFAADTPTISLSTGGTQNLRLSAGTAHAGELYLVLGSASGTTPGFSALGVPVPLNPDGWTTTTISGANVYPFANTVANLDALGIADASISFPVLSPALIGFHFDHAFVTFDAGVTTVLFASNAVGLTFAP